MSRTLKTLSALRAFTIGAIGSVTAAGFLASRPPGGLERWTRVSHAGRPVTLFEGPAYVVGAVAGALAGGAGAPVAVAGLAAGAFGALDDLCADTSSKGLRGHLAAASRGEVTTGAVKVLGLSATGAVTAWIVDRSRTDPSRSRTSPDLSRTDPVRTRTDPGRTRTDPGRAGAMSTLVGAAVIAGAANVVNLLDLRPGRALKVVILLALPIAAGDRGTRLSTVTAAAAAGAAMAVLPKDLAGRSMLGDTGANGAGALLGTALVARAGTRGRLLALVVVTALTLASEKVSFTTVIESTPGLRELDALGRPPALPPTVTP